MDLNLLSFIRTCLDSVCHAAQQRLRRWTKPDNRSLAHNAALDLRRRKSELVLENALLRQQLIVLQRQVNRPTLTWRDRALDDAWVVQQLREATPYGQGPRFLIRDNDNKFGAAFGRVAEGTDIEVLTTPYQAPKAKVICERFLGSVRHECLDFFLILNEGHLYKTMKQYQAYFNHARPHQGISQRIPCPPDQPQQQNVGKVISYPVLGGLHHDYRRRTPGDPSLPRAA